MTSALSNLMLAQQQFLEAFDLKEEALALQSDINNMKLQTLPKIFKLHQNTIEAQVLLNEKMKQNVLDVSGKANGSRITSVWDRIN